MNPLTKEERLRVAENILGHDERNQRYALYSWVLALIQGNLPNTPENIARIINLFNHINHVRNAHDRLVRKKELVLEKIDEIELDRTLDGLVRILDRKVVSYQIGPTSANYYSSIPLLYIALYELGNNSLRSLGVREKGIASPGLPEAEKETEKKVTISVSEYEGVVPSHNYPRHKHGAITSKHGLSGKFVKFTVHDEGPGFPNKPLTDFFRYGVTTKKMGSGFGLDLAHLIAKYLNSHLVIKSSPGHTTVSLYHPLDLDRR